MKCLRVAYADFWPNFDQEDNFFSRVLSDEYRLVPSNDPEICFHSCYGFSYRRFRCKRIFYTAECRRPNFDESDWALTFDRDVPHPRHYRLPYYAWVPQLSEVFNPKRLEEISEKERFCNFIYSNPRPQERKEFFKLLSAYRHVESGGKVFNNIGGEIPGGFAGKIEFMRQFKFSIAFENVSYPGYITEKIAHAMVARTVPIYWGCPQVGEDFNGKSYIDAQRFSSLEALADHVAEVDQDGKLYESYFLEPYFVGNRPNAFIASENVLPFLRKAIEDRSTPVARRPDIRLKVLISRFRRRIWQMGEKNGHLANP
jgi:hypothetical protein